MIERMEKICIYSLREQATAIMEEIFKCGAIQLERAQSMIPEDVEKILQKGKSLDLSREEMLAERIGDCISSLKKFGDKRGILYKRPVISYEELTSEKLLTDSIAACEAVEAITDKLERLGERRKTISFRESSLLPWESFELPVKGLNTRSTGIIFYILQEPRTIEDIYSIAGEQDLPLHAELISQKQEHQYIAVIFHKSREREVRESIGSLGAGEFSASDMAEAETFADRIASCRSELEDVEKVIRENEGELEKLASHRELLERASDALTIRIQYMSGRENFVNTEKVSIITGWVPASKKEEIKDRLEKYGCCCEYREAEDGEKPPVLMKNNRIVAPFGAITEMYSLPDPRSIDTNWAIGLFFFIFFGMMLSDAGYGLVLIVAGFCGAAFLDIGDGAKRLLKMLGICGISTMFWGALYGSWFGDVIPVVSETFFGRNVSIPQLLDPLEQPMTVLILSCILGVIHLFTGMGIKAYIMIRRGDIWGAVFDVGFWYMLLGGLLLLLAPSPWNTAGMVTAAAGAAGLVLTQGRHRPKLIGKVTSGVMSLYGITGYFSDVLSYSRILALGLATGVVASVVNIMASMAGGGIVGAVLFVIIFAAGHMLNLGINALGAYVHAARLQYVEFFGKYYESGGRKFEPLEIKTKYVRVMGEK